MATPCVMCLAPASKQCSGCRSFWYCTRECQRKHWVNHKHECGQVKNAPQHPEDLAEQERQFHTVTEIVRKHRETAKNKNVWVTRFGDKMYEDLDDARMLPGIKDKLDDHETAGRNEAALNMLFRTLAYFEQMKCNAAQEETTSPAPAA